MRIIPAIDIMDGKCVRLTQGDFRKKTVYSGNPLDVAKEFEDNGIRYLHLVDLDGARSNTLINTNVLERIATHTSLKIDFGGGVKTQEAIQTAFECGAHQVTGGSIAVKNETLFTDWIQRYGPEKIILGADVMNDSVAINGWREDARIALIPFLSGYIAKGISYVICTDISKDGLLEGCATALYRSVREQFPSLKLIASGGVHAVSDIDTLKEMNLDGVIIGKALYENKISLKQLRSYAD